MNEPISEATAGRLNALMRPMREVDPITCTQGILAAISDERTPEARIAALTYVFENKPWAYWSGPSTPASGFPKPFAPESDSADREAFKAVMNDQDFGLHISALSAQVRADRPSATERAKRALEFLEARAKTPLHRVLTLHFFLESDAFVVGSTPPREIKFDTPVPNADYDAALWKHRDVIAETNGAIAASTSGAIKTKSGLAWAIDQALSRIEDERERAIVRGWFMFEARQNIVGAQGIAALLESVHGLVCGGDHGEGEHEGG